MKWLAQRRGNQYAIIQAEDTFRTEEQVFSMLEVFRKILLDLVLAIGLQRVRDASQKSSRFPLRIFSPNRERLHKLCVCEVLLVGFIAAYWYTKNACGTVFALWCSIW